MPEKKVDVALSIRQNGRLLIGRDRIAVLEAVAEHGSITKAAEAAGVSYKTAWDVVNSINNLLPRPAFLTRSGGERGGGAEVTKEGLRLIAAFRRLEQRLEEFSAGIVEAGLGDHRDALFWGLGAKISARNAFRGIVTEVTRAPVDVQITLKLSETNYLTATVTNRAVVELGLEPGCAALAFIKAPLVTLLPGCNPQRIAGRNEFHGAVIERTDGGTNTEVLASIGEGKTITAVIAKKSADSMMLAPGSAVRAVFSPSHVILATD